MTARNVRPSRRDSALRAVLALLALAALVALYLGTDIVTGLERRLYDAAATSAAPRPLPEIAIIAIDDASLAKLGPWPWSYDLHAQLIDQLAAAGAKTIVHTSVFHAPQTDPGARRPLPVLSPIEVAEVAADTAAESQPVPVPETVPDAIDSAAAVVAQPEPEPEPEPQPEPPTEPLPDPDARLATSVQRAGNVLLAGDYVVSAGAAGITPVAAPLAQAHQSALPDPGAGALSATPAQLPLNEFDHASAGVGHMNLLADADGVVRRVPLLVRHDGVGVPSLALLAAAHSLYLGMGDVQRVPGPALRVGALTIPTNDGHVLRPHFYAPRQSQPVFALDSFHAVLGGAVDASKYQGKVVLVGTTAAALQVPVTVPGGQQWAPVQVLAHSISSIRQGHGYTQPAWGPQAMWLVLLVVGLHVLLGLPRWPVVAGAAITLGLLGVLLGVQAWLLASVHGWQPLVLPMLALLVGQVLHFFYRLRPVAPTRPQSDTQGDLAVALALQAEGLLDAAFDLLRRVPPDAAVLGNLHRLAQDYERKQQFSRAQAVYEHIVRHAPGDRDASAGRQRVRGLAQAALAQAAPATPATPSTPTTPVVPTADTAPQPVQTVVYDAVRDVNEHSNMVDFQEAVMDSAALPAPVATPDRAPPVAVSNTP